MAKSSWIDISLPIYPGMIGAPLDPPVKTTLFRDPGRGDKVTMFEITMIYHTGTHIDAPRHVFTDGASIDDIPLDTFVGPARVIEIKDTISIKPAELVPYNIKPGERILFKTKNSSWAYDSGKFVTGTVYITKESASFLIDKKVRMVGIDYITVGGEDREENRIVHKSFLESGVSLLEEINLAGAKAGKYELVAVPLRLRQGDAGPCRAIIRPI